MKILLLNHNLIWRGTFFRCMGFARELVKKGHSVDIWTVSLEPSFTGMHEIIDGVHVWQTPRWEKVGNHDGGYAPVDNLFRLMHSCTGNWDVVHAFDHRPNVLFPWLFSRFRNLFTRKKTLFISDWCDWWTCGGITTGRRRFGFVDKIEQQFEEKSKMYSHGVTVISSVLLQRSLEIGIPEKRLLLLPSGVDLDQFPLLEKAACRHKLGFPQKGPYFGFVGFSLWDLELLAESFSLLKKQIPDAKLIVVGGGVEEEAKSIFYNLFQVGEDVFLPGVVPFTEIPVFLGACDIQLLPMKDTIANRARVPNKLFDYYASGRPIIASNVGDTGSYVQKHRTGFAAGQTPSDFARCMVELLLEKDSSEQAGKNARKYAEEEFSSASVTGRLESFYVAMRGSL